MDAKISLSRASILEEIIRETMIIIQSRIGGGKSEPSRFLQKNFSPKRRDFIDLNIQGLLGEDFSNFFVLFV
jgi:hypothetical protein